MSVQHLQNRLQDLEQQMGELSLEEYFQKALLPEYSINVKRWIWANDQVLDVRPLWVQRESSIPDSAQVLTLPPLDKSGKWNYGLDELERVVVARQDNDYSADLRLYKYEGDLIEGVHFFSYDSNNDSYMSVSECERIDGKLSYYVAVNDFEVDSEEYQHDEVGRVVRVTRERNFYNPDAENAKAKRLHADLDRLRARRRELGLDSSGVEDETILAKPSLIVMEYRAVYDDRGLAKLELHRDGTMSLVYQRSN